MNTIEVTGPGEFHPEGAVVIKLEKNGKSFEHVEILSPSRGVVMTATGFVALVKNIITFLEAE